MTTFLKILIGALTVVMFAQFEIVLPWNEAGISVTGQSFAVLVVGFLLGGVGGGIALLVYLLFGIMGLPAFAGGASGWEVLTGGSGGYLIGFPVAAALVGYLGDRKWGDQFTLCLLAMLIGTLVILIFGIVRLTWLYDFPRALEYGFYPVLPGAIIKIFFGALVVWLFNRYDLGGWTRFRI